MKRILQYAVLGLMASTLMASGKERELSRVQAQGGVPPNPSYDGRYAFARLRYTEIPDDPCTCPVGEGYPYGWGHDYPEGDRNLMHIATDLTTMHAWTDSTAVFAADDPQIMKYPILYLSEPACWRPKESEVLGLRKYLLKGGFLIVDDFSICSGGAVRFETSKRVFEEQMRRVLPDARTMAVAWTDPEVNNFFKLDPDAVAQELTRASSLPPQIYAIYERNDPKRRMMVAANYNTVIHRSWVWEAQGLSPVANGNEAYKLGVNFLLYGFTH